ncbi:MAG: Crp/Fnr family transcriptional regulator [Lagierella massiliensis]|nr:Crp/Fnr family transcriptional regulator [Lagierella massiliensis]
MKTCTECSLNGSCLSKVNLFKDLDLSTSKSLFLSSIHKDYEKNQEIFNSNDKVDKIIIIRYGKIKTNLYDELGNEYIENIYITGDTIGEDGIFLDKKFEVNGVTLEKTGICIINKDLIKNILIDNPSFSIKMIENLTEKLYKSQKLLAILSIKDSYKRLAAFLLYRSTIINNPIIELNQENIASSINMSRETVSRKISELEKDGLIDLIAYKKIKLKNIPLLMEISKI